MNFDNHAQPNYPIYNDAYRSHATHAQDEQNRRSANYHSTNCDLWLCEPHHSPITKAVSAPEECSQVTAEIQARETTFPSSEMRTETAMNSDTTQPVRTFHAVRSKQMSERVHKQTKGQNLTSETTDDLERKEPESIGLPVEEFKTQEISLASKPPDDKIVTSKPPNCSGEVNTIAVLGNADDLSRPHNGFISEPCQSIQQFSAKDDVVQITHKENEIQYCSCEENSVVQVEEVISDVHLEEVFSVPSISQQVLKDKQNIQHGSIGSRLNPAVEPVYTRHKTDGQESVALTSIEPEIIFEIVESQDNTVTEVNSHFAFQETTVSCHLLNEETVYQIAKSVKTCGDPQGEQFHSSQNIFEHIGTTAIRCGMIYFLIGLLFTLVNNVAESFKRMCWSIFKFFHAFLVQMTKVCSLSTDFPARSHSQNVDSETNATGKAK